MAKLEIRKCGQKLTSCKLASYIFWTYFNPLTDLITSSLLLPLFQFSLGYCRHVVSFQTLFILLLDMWTSVSFTKVMMTCSSKCFLEYRILVRSPFLWSWLTAWNPEDYFCMKSKIPFTLIEIDRSSSTVSSRWHVIALFHVMPIAPNVYAGLTILIGTSLYWCGQI